jgi:hypothetical protein
MYVGADGGGSPSSLVKSILTSTHMCECWGGVPERTVCDNLKTGVAEHPREGGGRARRRLRGARRAPHDGRHARPGQEAQAGGLRRGRRPGRGHLGGSPAQERGARRHRGRPRGGPAVPRRLQRAPVPGARGQPRLGARGGRGRRARAASPTSATTPASGPATARSAPTSTSPTPGTATPFPTATSGGGWACAWASRRRQSATPASASPRTRSSPPTRGTPTRPTGPACRRRSPGPSGTTRA